MSRDILQADGGGTASVLDLVYSPIIKEVSNASLLIEDNVSNVGLTNLHITVSELDMGIDPDGYFVKYQLYGLDGVTPDGPEVSTYNDSQLVFRKYNVTGVRNTLNKIVYTCTNDYSVGDYVTVLNTGYDRFNVVRKKIIERTATTFTIDGTGIATLSQTQISGNAIQDIVLIGMSSGRWYNIKVGAYKGPLNSQSSFSEFPAEIRFKTAYYDVVTKSRTLPSNIYNQTAGKSYLELTNENSLTAIIHKKFDSIDKFVPTSYQVGWNGVPVSLAGPSYYSYGTNLYFGNQANISSNHAGGIGIFVDDTGTVGYFLQLSTTYGSAIGGNKKSFRILKVHGNDVDVLKDSQISDTTTYEGILPGTTYSIDVKVKYTPSEVRFLVSINGYSIVVKDSYNSKNKIKNILEPTQGVALFCSQGKAMFDYVYASSITADQYSKSEYTTNFYRGQFSNDLLNTTYGDLTYNSGYAEDEISKKPASVEEFGTTAREIYRLKTRFDNRPSQPIDASIGANQNVSILGQSLSPFQSEVFVLNNSSVTVPLEDSASNNLYVFGNQITKSAQQQYSTLDYASYNYLDPVVFESMWIQNESDAELLAKWIHEKVVNRGKNITMEIFGNPMITPGDLIHIKYEYQGLMGTEKFIVVSVSHSFNQGLTTSITCRTL